MIRPLLLLTALAPATVAAQVRFQDTAAIDVAVAAFTGHAIGEDGGARTPVDRRLKLAACPLPELDWRGGNQDAVLVRCTAPAWRIYVPVRMPPTGPRTVATSSAPTVTAVKPEPVIRRGDPVTVEAGTAGFSITRDGIAMGDATPGARFMVKVDPAKPPIQAVAIETGRATLPGWGQ
jgi:flagella basal body P-ring formation protein FlgA